MPTIKFSGILQMDLDNGVIWFNADQSQQYQWTVLRIGQLPTPMPDPTAFGMLDLTWKGCVNYRGQST